MTSGGPHIVLSVRLPDRPGALGAVASRLGALRADITDIVVSRRDDGAAVDVFHLDLPQDGLTELIHTELGEVDGVVVEGWHTATDCC